jgi:hypothetical protein
VSADDADHTSDEHIRDDEHESGRKAAPATDVALRRAKPFGNGRRWFVAIVALALVALGLSYALETDPLEVTVTASAAELNEFCTRYLAYQEQSRFVVTLDGGPAPVEVSLSLLTDAAAVAPSDIRSDIDTLVATTATLVDEIRRLQPQAQTDPDGAKAEFDTIVADLNEKTALEQRRVTDYYAKACSSVTPSTAPQGSSGTLVTPGTNP